VPAAGSEAKPFPHLVHVILTVLTCGLWLPIYGLHYCVRGPSGGALLSFMLVVSLFFNVLTCGGFIALSVTHSWYLFAAVNGKSLTEPDK